MHLQDAGGHFGSDGAEEGFLHDFSLALAVDEKAVKKAGAAGVIRPSKTACQVVIGPKVQFVYDDLKKML